MAECAWNDAFEFVIIGYAHHRKCFATACLPVGKYGAIISLHHGLHQIEGSLLVYRHLCGIQAEDAVVGEVFIVVSFVRFT